MTTSHPLYIGATRARRTEMVYARGCVDAYQRTLNAAYLTQAHIHVRTARAYNRSAWRAKGSK